MWQNFDFDPTILTLGTGNNVKGVFVYTDNESIKLQTTKEQYEKQGQWKCYICINWLLFQLLQRGKC